MLELDRRELLKLMGFGVVTVGAGTVFAGSARAASRSPESELPPSTGSVATPAGVAAMPAQATAPAAPIGDAPWWLVQPYRAGSTVAGARLVGMTPMHDGVVTLDLVQAGQGRFQIHICSRDAGLRDTPPPARSSRYDFLLANGGKGDKQTSQAQGEAVLALAQVVRRNEGQHEPLPLVTMRERWRRLAVTR